MRKCEGIEPRITLDQGFHLSEVSIVISETSKRECLDIFRPTQFEKENANSQNRKPNTFTFLGFTHFCDKTLKGYFKVGRKVAMKKFRAKIKEFKNI